MECTMELRWIQKESGEFRLQQKWVRAWMGVVAEEEWRDVPFVKDDSIKSLEEKKYYEEDVNGDMQKYYEALAGNKTPEAVNDG